MAKAKELPRFEVGDAVAWSSQARGCHLEKHGTVRAVIAAGVDSRAYFDVFRRESSLYKVQSGCETNVPRSVDSYIVEVQRLSKSGKPVKSHIYFPLTSALRRT